MEAESASAVLQCFLDLDNFHQLLSSSSPSSQQVTWDCATAQDDAILIYDKYNRYLTYRKDRYVDR